jgi:hypothetical protein
VEVLRKLCVKEDAAVERLVKGAASGSVKYEEDAAPTWTALDYMPGPRQANGVRWTSNGTLHIGLPEGAFDVPKGFCTAGVKGLLGASGGGQGWLVRSACISRANTAKGIFSPFPPWRKPRRAPSSR